MGLSINIIKIFFFGVIVITAQQYSFGQEKYVYPSEAIRLQASAERCLDSNKLDSAAYYYLQAAVEYGEEEDFEKQANAFNNAGNMYLNLARNNDALESYINAANIFESKGIEGNGLGRTLFNIANIQSALGNYEKVLEYAEQSRKLSIRENDELALVYIKRLLGRAYRKLKRTDEAVNEMKEVIGLFRAIDSADELAETYANLANIYFDIKQYNQALAMGDSSLYFDKQSSFKNTRYVYSLFGFIYFDLKDYERSRHFFEESIKEAKRTNDPYIEMDGYRKLTDISAVYGDYEGHDKNMSAFLNLRDSIELVESKAKADEMEARYQNDVKQREIEVLLLERELKDARLAKQQNQQILYLVILVFVLLTALGLINRYRVINRNRRLLEVERIRNAIARDLHDDLGSTLSSIHILSQIGQQTDNKENKGILSKISNHSSIMMDRLSEIVWSIHPDNDNIEEMFLKMKEFAVEILEPQGIDCYFQIGQDIDRVVLDIDKRKNIFLIFKEAVNNTAKYSRGNRFDVFIELRDAHLQIEVKDDGVGFDPDMSPKGNGLRNMRERAEVIGSQIEIESCPGEGVSITIKTPLT